MRGVRQLIGRLVLATGLLVTALAAPAVAGVTGHAAPRGRSVPRIGELGRVPFVSVRDRVLRDGRRLATTRRATSHGGTYTAATGEQLKVYVSDTYPVDDTVNQHWADFIARLVHGREISTVTVYVAPYSEMQALCGSVDVDACYLLREQEMIVPGEIPPDGTPVEEIAAHEYGHHVAVNRSNWPWPAAAWGTKRWASHVHVCERVLAHTAFPGDEAANYLRNPGEAFAESYRVLNGRRAPLSNVQLPWVMDGFDPDPTALALLEQDVLHPWTGSTISRWRGRLTARGFRRLTLPTPRDGVAKFVLHGPRGSALAVLDSATGKVLGAARVQISYGVCGERKVSLAVALTRPGRFSVALFRP